jgi:hypothetical protein
MGLAVLLVSQSIILIVSILPSSGSLRSVRWFAINVPRLTFGPVFKDQVVP